MSIFLQETLIAPHEDDLLTIAFMSTRNCESLHDCRSRLISRVIDRCHRTLENPIDRFFDHTNPHLRSKARSLLRCARPTDGAVGAFGLARCDSCKFVTLRRGGWPLKAFADHFSSPVGAFALGLVLLSTFSDTSRIGERYKTTTVSAENANVND